MKTKLITALIITLFLTSITTITTPVKANVSPKTINYGDVTLSGGFQAGHFPDVWDLTSDDMVISFTYDANGLVDDDGCHAWAELGVRSVGYGDFNPTWMKEGAGVWLATDFDWKVNTFDPDPEGSPTLDLDDKLILQKGGGLGEASYSIYKVDGEDVEFTPPNPWANYGVWFDRDGVDEWQANMWGAIDGGTYNTNGIYYVVITLHAISDTEGVAYMTVNGVSQGFYAKKGWKNAPPEYYPAGMTFTGDMRHMQVFYGLFGYGATHTVEFRDIQVTGVAVLIATIDIDPDTLNLKSKGKWVTCYIGLPEGYSPRDIDISSVTLVYDDDHIIPAERGKVQGNVLMVKFDRSKVAEILSPGEVELMVTGKLTDGTPFEGSDTIRVIAK